MKKVNYKYIIALAVMIMVSASCEKFYDINKDPDNILDAPLTTILTSATVNIGFTGGSDLNRYSSLIMQQYSGQSQGALNQTQQYEQYLITGADANNLFASIYSTVLNDLETIIAKGTEEGSPHYTGVAKILKAYVYQISVDAWGDLPYSEAQLQTANTQPKYDDDEQIYTEILNLCNAGIAEINAAESLQSPDINSTIYPAEFSVAKTNWERFANTLKLRIYLHYSEKDAAFATSSMNTLISSGAEFFTSNADNFQMAFLGDANAQNPIDQFETARPGYLVANNTLVTLMNTSADPRRAAYFTEFPEGSGAYVGAKGGDAPSQDYSKLGSYLRGAAGEAPIRMLTYAEYNFIRAEAALRFGVAGSAQEFYTEGIRASMADAGVTDADAETYLGVNGILTGTPAEQLQQIIGEKYIASYGVVMEPWTDWRRTGYPAITPPVNAVIDFVPRSLYYPQSEIDLNPNAKQKTGLDSRVFWDARQ